MAPSSRLLRPVLALLVVAGVLFGFAATASAAPTTVTPASAEAQFVELLNAERARLGLPAMARDRGLDTVARDWSASMAAVGTISHRTDLSEVSGAVEPRWERAGENVGQGGDVPGLHRAFMDSPGHRANVVGAYNRVGVGVTVRADGRIFVSFNFLQGPEIPAAQVQDNRVVVASPGSAAWLVSADGRVGTVGDAPALGDLGGSPLNRPIVGMTATGTRDGYWLVASDGGIFAFGDASFLGSTGAVRLNQPIVGMAATPSGEGYWLVASDGGIFAFGDAAFHGSTGGTPLNRPIVGMASTPSGEGYWLVASDGGIFAFGDASFHGSTGDRRLTHAVNGITATPGGQGYWIVDGGGTVHAFGDAAALGSATGQGQGQPFTRIAATPDGAGYRLATADGRVFSFGTAGSGVSGSLGWTSPVVALADATA